MCTLVHGKVIYWIVRFMNNLKDKKKEFFGKFAAGGGTWKVFTEGRISPEQVWQFFEDLIKEGFVSKKKYNKTLDDIADSIDMVKDKMTGIFVVDKASASTVINARKIK